jgi:predicted MFS family arabinose efflux permease
MSLLTETRERSGWQGTMTAVRAVPGVITGSLRLVRRSRILQGLILIELCWGFGATAYESLTPVRLAEVVDDAERAGALMGPAAAAAWFVSAAGAALAPRLAGRIGITATAAVTRLAQGVFVAAMGLSFGAGGVLVAFLACYFVQGASSPMHMTLVHREVTEEHRATVVSLSSMVFQPAAAVGLIALTAVGESVSLALAMLVGGVIIAAATPLYLPAYRAERRREPAGGVEGPPAGSVA